MSKIERLSLRNSKRHRETQNDIEIPERTKFSLKIDRHLRAQLSWNAPLLLVLGPVHTKHLKTAAHKPLMIAPTYGEEYGTRVPLVLQPVGGRWPDLLGRRYFWAAVEDPGVKYMDIWYQPSSPGRAQYCLLWPSRIDLVWWLLAWWRRSVGVPARLLDGSWRTHVTRRS